MAQIKNRIQQQLIARRGLRERMAAVTRAATPAYRHELEAIFQRDEEPRSA